MSDQFVKHITTKIEDKDWKAPFFNWDDNKTYNNINLGVPHGMTGVLLILLLIKEKNGLNIDHLILRLTEEFLSYKLHNSKYNFPSQIWEDQRSSPSGISWCYGDLMAAYAILKVGVLLNKKDYYSLAEKILIDTLDRKSTHNQTLVLCHGYISLSIIYDKIFEITQNNLFQTQSKYWESIAIEDFKRCHIEYEQSNKHADFFENPSLFIGFSGFFLSLLAWKNRDNGDWTTCLLL